MPDPTVLFVTRSTALVKPVKAVVESIPHLSLDVCPVERGCARVRQEGVALVLAHLPQEGDVGLASLLWAVNAARRPCATLVLSDRHQEHQAGALLRAGAAGYLEVPAELPRLAFLLKAL